MFEKEQITASITLCNLHKAKQKKKGSAELSEKRIFIYLAHIIELHAVANWPQKLKLIGNSITPPHMQAPPWNIGVDNNLFIKLYQPGFKAETSGFDTILSCMHQPIDPKSQANWERWAIHLYSNTYKYNTLI